MTPPSSATARAKANDADPVVATVERPTPAGVNAPGFGSDVIADALRALDVPYIALTPGASYRGLHDSIVNYLGNTKPQMLLCLHEEAAVAIAHGYAKVTGKAMVTAVHSNVGLMHATMAMFNAWCDRMPVVVLGATGPVDAAKRRPWIDWIHTARDQGALVREYTKWDDQPSSPGAAREAILRGTWIANTAPCGPVYINFDAELQEARVSEPLPPIDVARYMPHVTTAAPAELVREAAAVLKGAKQVLLLAGRASRSMEAWNARVALAEALNAGVVTDLKIGATFPTDHPLYVGSPRAITPDIVEEIGKSEKPHAMPTPRRRAENEPAGFTNEHIARALRNVLGNRPVTYTHLPLSWDDSWIALRHPLDYIGSDGGGGVGGGPGISVGAALALKGSGRLSIAICGDGDFLMGVTALWTAVHYKIPLLFVLANNRSFYNDELHQERMARARNRPIENKWIGQRMADPEVDLAAMGRAQGAAGFGPVTKSGDLAGVLQQAIAAVDAGQVAVVDVRVEPGYTAAMTAAMTRGGS